MYFLNVRKLIIYVLIYTCKAHQLSHHVLDAPHKLIKLLLLNSRAIFLLHTGKSVSSNAYLLKKIPAIQNGTTKEN